MKIYSMVRVKNNFYPHLYLTCGPAHKILVLISSASSEDSGEPALKHGLTRTLAAHIHKVWMLRKA